MTNYQFEHGSFRDRNSRVFYGNGAIYRVLNEQALKEWKALLSKTFFKQFMDEGKLVHTEQVDTADKLNPVIMDGWEAVLKHQTIPFIHGCVETLMVSIRNTLTNLCQSVIFYVGVF